MKTLVVICAVLLMAPVGRAQKKAESPELTAARQGIALCNERGMAAAKAKDGEAEAAIYTDDAIVMPPGKHPVVGHKAIVAFFRDMYSGPGRLLEQENTPVDVVLLGDGLAVEIAYFRGTFGEPGKPPTEFKGKSMILYKRQPDGTWKMYRDMWDVMN